MLNGDLVNIKDKYGEGMMHLCRKNFSTILETPGLLFELLSSHFPYSRFLYEDIVNNSLEDMFKNYIYGLMTSEEEELPEFPKTPFELLNDVGYNLYECFSEEDIQSYRKYYHTGEELCSFRGGRLDKFYVFFAVKKDVDNIKREDFINPLRQDLYGTSVISIQFTRGNVNTLSIKNRYNHRVDNPDATYSNNLENIVPGLTRSFERDYNLNINQNECGGFEIPGYVLAKDGKYYKYNYEINNIYYCIDNIIIDNFEVIRDYQEKEKYLIVDYFVIDLVNKKISLYDKNISDSFIDGLDNIKNIDINKDKNTGKKILDITFLDGSNACIEIDKYNRIISYKNENITSVEDNFLHKNIYLENIDIPNVVRIGNNFLYSNMKLENVCFNKLLSIGNGFISLNKSINKIELDDVMKIGRNFLSNNESLVSINMPNLEGVGDNFLVKNRSMKEVYIPNLVSVGDGFLKFNRSIKTIILPKLVYVGDDFIAANKIMEGVYLPSLVRVGGNFLYSNKSIRTMDLNNLESVGDNFMYCNIFLESINLPKLKFVGIKFLYMNDGIVRLELPELIKADRYFMYDNNSLKILLVPRLKIVGKGFLTNNNVLEYVEVDIEQLDGYVRCFGSIYVNIKKRVLIS